MLMIKGCVYIIYFTAQTDLTLPLILPVVFLRCVCDQIFINCVRLAILTGNVNLWFVNMWLLTAAYTYFLADLLFDSLTDPRPNKLMFSLRLYFNLEWWHLSVLCTSSLLLICQCIETRSFSMKENIFSQIYKCRKKGNRQSKVFCSIKN